MTGSQGPKILLLTNSEFGEANVFLATSHAILQADPTVELHFATFGGLRESVAMVSQKIQATIPETKPIVFHKIHGLTMSESLRNAHPFPASFLAPPGFLNTIRAIRDTVQIFVPYSGPQLVQIFLSIVGIINTVNADLIVVNSLMTTGLTACCHLGVKFACLSPNSIKDFAASKQPWAAALWKFPALDAEKYLMVHTGAHLRTPVDLLHNRLAHLKILVSTLPELDFPLIIPENIIPCGPILKPHQCVSGSDLELGNWLALGSTIYVNLGSICQLTASRAIELAFALKTTLEVLRVQANSSRFQVLWKLKLVEDDSMPDSDDNIEAVLGDFIQDDLVRIAAWIEVEPSSILQSGHIACSVHHGGANSYNEAIKAGVPQVVLPQWTDCYDYAQRVELLGIGRLGSRKAKPHWSADELSKALLDVLISESSAAIKDKAIGLANLCDEKGNGADVAARVLLDECRNTVPLGSGTDKCSALARTGTTRSASGKII
ncbi:hypothetical protein Aspvir_006056 [Aspergillus viridinutans]|uniref:Erythromycin biosynthesis protein CIII-like C-terminal domain-containing protein n=1 Tax=Aspergillus viridinutans TaxID=75553 RepID=A0A9P3BWQ4_ASPVI|nr:uncharacterized protein Aspvir_006056 [Aspergillus viridinutans]GIK02013.1 hypothetical protein Aspvir_006056 [Aspergillus viridinutans]